MPEAQRMADVPKTPQQAERQKGPVPKTAIFLALGLAAVFVFFFVLPAVKSVENDPENAGMITTLER